jgi:hypothetical protein
MFQRRAALLLAGMRSTVRQMWWEHCEVMTPAPGVGRWEGGYAAADQVCWSVDSNLAAFYTHTHTHTHTYLFIYLTIYTLSSDLRKIRLALDLSERNCLVS